MRSVVDDPERVDEVVRLVAERRPELLRVRLDELDAVGHAHHLSALRRERERLAREVDRSQLRAGAREVNRVGADTAAHLEDALSVPAVEVREGRNVRLDEVLAGLDLVEVLARPDRLRRMADVAGTRVPVALHVRDGLLERATTHTPGPLES
jgi:hypothetical protein